MPRALQPARSAATATPWYVGHQIAAFAAHIWTLRNGKLLRNEPFHERESAVRAAGLGE
jgi:hypothetical protein